MGASVAGAETGRGSLQETRLEVQRRKERREVLAEPTFGKLLPLLCPVS